MAIVDGHIRCGKCGNSKPLAAFMPSDAEYGAGYCRECRNAYLRDYREQNQDRIRGYNMRRDPASQRRYQLAQAEKFRALAPDEQRRIRRARHLKHRYSITPAQYAALLSSQDGGCACCGSREPGRPGGAPSSTERRFVVDHCHISGAVRGLLCQSCNKGIGALGDTAESVRRAVNYLERAQQSPPVRAVPALRINLLQGAN